MTDLLSRNHRQITGLRLSARSLTTLSLLTLPLLTAGLAAAQPFACTGEAFIVQEVPDAQLTQVDQTVDPLDFMVLATYNSTELNNMGFSRADGFLYGLELTGSGNNGIIRIGSTYAMVPLGSGNPALPSNQRFDAGDVSADGSTLYVNRSGLGTLYSVPLPSLDPIASVTISGGAGFVFDWAAHPSDGLLYGGDRDGGQLAVLDPASGSRTDMAVNGCAVIGPTCTAASLPSGSGVAYGGAWFNAAELLFLYENTGQLFVIDVSGTPTIVATQAGPGSNRNDGAACVQDIIGAAKQMTSDNPNDVPANVTINYLFENLSGTETLSNLSAADDLTASFGTQGADWTFTSINSGSGTFHNASFDGSSDTELINQAPAQSLSAGASDTITVVIQLQTAAAADADDMMCNQVLALGEAASGTMFGDLSTDDNSTSDPNGDGSPDEREPTCITQLPVSLIDFTIE